MYTIEWQERGLTRAHVLLRLNDKMHALQIDSIISAEFHDPEHDPQLFAIVESHMIHQPCGPLNPASVCKLFNVERDNKLLGKKLSEASSTTHTDR